MQLIRLLPCFALAAAAAAQASWSVLYPPSVPPVRYGASFGALEDSGTCLLLFGWDGITGTPRTDSWRLQGSDWSVVNGAQPPWRQGAAVAYDASRSELVLFGGSIPGGPVFDDTWRWNGSSWSQALPVNRPPARFAAAMAFDRERAVMVIFCGRGVGSPPVLLGDTWEWDGTDWQQPVLAVTPPPREGGLLAFDPAGPSVLLHSGVGPGGSLGTLFADTWSYDGTSWVQRLPATPPPYRVGARMVTDLHRQRVVLLGGDLGDVFTWEWNGAQWHVTYQPTPAPRAGFGMAYDAQARRTVVHGGSLFAGGGSFFFNDTWVYRTPLPADVVPFGAGCAGSVGTPVLANAPYALPWLGDTMRNVVGNVPPDAPGVLIVSSSRISAPLPLAFLGMPGCDLLVLLDVLDLVTASGGTAQWAFTIPNTTALAGAAFRQQAFVPDPTANAFGLVASNGVTVTIGVR